MILHNLLETLLKELQKTEYQKAWPIHLSFLLYQVDPGVSLHLEHGVGSIVQLSSGVDLLDFPTNETDFQKNND